MDSAYIKFNGGIWSDVLKGRYDLGNYKSAARTCENFIPTRYGQVEKRAGTKHLGFAKNDGKKCVLVPFQFSVNTKFILEMGDQYIRFWSNDLQVESAPATPLEVVTPYLEAELYEIQTRAVNDIVYITHPNHPVGKLTRLSDTNWTYAVADLELPFVDPDVNSTVVTLTPDALTGSIGIAASADAFDADHVGSELRLKYLTEGTSVSSSMYDSWNPDVYNPDDYSNPLDRVTSWTKTDTYTPRPVLATPATDYYRVRYTQASVQQMATCILDYDPSTAWAAGTFSVDDLVTFSGDVYICTAARVPSDTDDPTVDTASWNEVVYPLDAPAYWEAGVFAILPQEVIGEWSFKTTGTWTGTWWIQRSLDDGATWSTIKSLTSANDSNYLVEEDEGGVSALIRVLMKASATTYQDDVTLTTLTTPSYGVATVTTVTDAQNVVATVTTDMPSLDPCVSWQESAFSSYQGYPRSIALFDNRLLLAGTAKKPQAFFYSEINTYDNFLAATTLADAPFFVETLSDDQSAVQWITAQRELFVGTASVEGVLTTRKQDEAQSPENLPIVRWNESMGSAHRAALPMRDSLLILQRGRTVLNMLSYSIDKDGYTGEEVSLLCPQIFSSGVLQMAHLREPYTGAYVVTEDGTICHMIYEPKLQVTGWCKYTTQGGNFESVAVLPSSLDDATLWGSTTDEDDLWCVVERTIDGTTRRHIERFTTGNTAKQEDNDSDNLYYLDAAVKATGTGLTSVSGLDHLEGETVCVLADGIKGSYVVASGSITLSVAADTVVVGLPITSTFEPFDLETEQSVGKRKQLYQSKLMVWRSLGGSIAHDGEDYQDLIYHTAGETMDESVPLKDGYMEVFHESAHSRQKYWRIQHDEPHPFTLQAVVQTFTVSKH